MACTVTIGSYTGISLSVISNQTYENCSSYNIISELNQASQKLYNYFMLNTKMIISLKRKSLPQFFKGKRLRDKERARSLTSIRTMQVFYYTIYLNHFFLNLTLCHQTPGPNQAPIHIHTHDLIAICFDKDKHFYFRNKN